MFFFLFFLKCRVPAQSQIYVPYVIDHGNERGLTERLVYTAIEADDPLHTTTDRTPLTGNISSSAGGPSNARGGLSSSYLTSSIPGEDRRAPQNTIDETVWQTLSRDLFAVWEKMRQVLYPKYLLGGMLTRGGGGIGGTAERGESSGFGSDGLGGRFRGLVGRWPDAEVVLQGGMSDGLRDWDLWYVGLLGMFWGDEMCGLTEWLYLGVRWSFACS